MDQATSEQDRVLFITNCYAGPEEVSVGASIRMFQFVKTLVGAQWRVNVVTASTSPLMEPHLLPGDYERASEQQVLPPNPRVDHVEVRVLSSSSIWARLLHYADFFLGALKLVFKQNPVPSLVFASMPTILIGTVGALGAWRYKVPFILDVRDLWSDSLQSTKLAHIPGFISLNLAVERKIYRSADRILVTTEAQRQYILRNSDCCRESVILIPNGFDFEYRNEETSICTKTSLDIHKLKSKYRSLAMFAGKHAAYTNLRTVIDAALLEPNIGFVLIGGGYEKSDVMQYAHAKRVRNVFFFDPVPKAEILSLMRMADLFIINYSSSDAWSKVIPNKLFDYLFFNKPIVAAVCDGEISDILKKCGGGVVVPPDDPVSLVDACRRAANGEVVAIYNRDFLMRNYDRASILKTYLQTFSGFR